MSDLDLFPRYGAAYADVLRADNAKGKPTALGTPLRMSSAGACLLAQQLDALGVTPTNPPDEASLWSMRLGTLAHADIQAALAERYPGCEAEVKVVDGPGSSGHIDVTFRRPDGTVPAVIEVKTMGQFPFSLAVGVSTRGYKRLAEGPHGPKATHLLQAARSANAVGADEMTLLYLCVDPLARSLAEKLGLTEAERWRAEWTYPADVYEPWVDEEHRRLALVMGHLETGTLAPRLTVDDNATPRVLDPTSDNFPCGWCNHRETCLALHASDATTVEELTAMTGAA